MPTLFDNFKARAEAVSGEVHRCRTRTDALMFLQDFLRSEVSGEESAVWVDGPFLNGLDRQELVRQFSGLTFEVTKDSAERSKVGITQAEWAIANTGTLVMDAAPVARRLASALPAIHIALVPTGSIVPDMASAFARLSPAQSGYISFLTGPSRTADIERVLTIGVHGPSRLVVLFVDEMGAN